MMNHSSDDVPVSGEKGLPDDEIDLRQLTGALTRRWPWIAGGGTLGLILAIINLLSTKPVFQGEFQIVLNTLNSAGGAGMFSQNSTLATLLSGSTTGDSIATEVQILNSPSVLLPVFDAVKARKPDDVAKTMRFQDWAKSAITAEQKKNTSVLSVQFRDTDKELVLPVTQLISEIYQKYSNRGRARELSNLISYLKTQIKDIKIKADTSSMKALDYGYANGLGLLDGLPLAGDVAGAGYSRANRPTSAQIELRSGSLEAARTKALQKLRGLEMQLNQASIASTGSLYIASQLSSLTDKSSTFDKLTSVETRLAELRSRLKDTDPLVQKLQRERNTLVGYINNQTISLLKGEIDLVKATLKALDRPKEVVRRHRELTQQALRDVATRVTLENQLKQFELEQARAASPWELISTPSLLDSPVSPSRRRTLAVGLFAGLAFGCGCALISDRRSGRVFSSYELSSNLPGPLLQRLPCKNNDRLIDSWKAPIQLLADGPLAGDGSVAVVPVGEIGPEEFEAFTSSLRQALGPQRELMVSRDLVKTRSCSTQLLLAAPGVAKRELLRQLIEQLALQGTPVAGWVLLDSDLKA